MLLGSALVLVVAAMFGNGWSLLLGDDQRTYLTHRTAHPGMLDLAGLSERTPIAHERRLYTQLGTLTPGSRYIIEEDAARLVWRGRDRLWLVGLGAAEEVEIVPRTEPAVVREASVMREGTGRWFAWQILLGSLPVEEIRVVLEDGVVVLIDSALLGGGW